MASRHKYIKYASDVSDSYVEQSVSHNTTNQDWESVLVFNAPNVGSGDYLFQWFTGARVIGHTNGQCSIRILLDGDTDNPLVEVVVLGCLGNGWKARTGKKKVTLTAGSPTFDFQIKKHFSAKGSVGVRDILMELLEAS